MNKLKNILGLFEIEEKVIEQKYSSIMRPPCLPNYFDDMEREEREKELKQMQKELQLLNEEKSEAIDKFYKDLENKISKMTDRELLEAIYKNILTEID